MGGVQRLGGRGPPGGNPGGRNDAVYAIFRQAAAVQHRAAILPRYDDMIHDRKSELAGDLHNMVGRQAVRLGRNGQPGGMVVCQNAAGRVGAGHGAQQLAGVHGHAVGNALGNAQVLHRAAGVVQ